MSFVAEDEATERQIAIMATELGYTNIRVLRGGLAEFRSQFLDARAILHRLAADEEQTLRFQQHARTGPAGVDPAETLPPVR